MELYFRKLGEGESVIIILHGLYGSSDNWIPAGKKLAENHTVYLLDQRNHGKSPHSSKHNYYLLLEDLKEFFDSQGIQKASIIGHSMGGKTAMFFANKYPEMVTNLIVVDISPKSYKISDNEDIQNINHLKIIDAMKTVDFTSSKNLNDIEIQLFNKIKDKRISQFLLKNISKDEKGYKWTINLNTIAMELTSIMDGIKKHEIENMDGITSFPVLFIKGEKSNYIKSEDEQLIKKLYPYSKLIKIENAGHWVHAEQFNKFMISVQTFLD